MSEEKGTLVSFGTWGVNLENYRKAAGDSWHSYVRDMRSVGIVVARELPTEEYVPPEPPSKLTILMDRRDALKRRFELLNKDDPIRWHRARAEYQDAVSAYKIYSKIVDQERRTQLMAQLAGPMRRGGGHSIFGGAFGGISGTQNKG